MAIFVIEDRHLQRMSPASRRELLKVVAEDIADLRAWFADHDWDPEGKESYPLTVEEARLLIRGIPEPARRALEVFVRNYDGTRGTATLEELLEATGHTKHENVSRQLTWLLIRLRSVTGNPDAWLINWHARDWEWDESEERYTEGRYFVSGRAVESLRDAFAAENEPG